jgi:hypothetical protein
MGAKHAIDLARACVTSLRCFAGCGFYVWIQFEVYSIHALYQLEVGLYSKELTLATYSVV